MNEVNESVVIVGAGPTGLTLGAELLRLGIPAVILDRGAAGENTSRACVVHARTLEVLEPMGATAELLRRGLIVPLFRVRDRTRILATISFKELKTSYPFTLMCPQDRVEAVLLARLEALGGTVLRRAEVLEVQPSSGTIPVLVQNGHGARRINARWVVGCDGSRSIVREQAAIPFEGGAYDESFVLADAEMDWPLDREEVTLFYSEKGLMVVAPLPDNRYRIVATVDDASPQPSVSDFQQLLNERGPQNGPLTIRRLAWSSRFRLQHRVAKALRRGNILLAGDAAHVHSPAGGQGMNTGIQDAVSLAEALHRTIRQGDETALERWERERLKVAHSVVSLTDRMTRIATLSSPALKMLRNTAVEWMGHLPFARRLAAEELSELRSAG